MRNMRELQRALRVRVLPSLDIPFRTIRVNRGDTLRVMVGDYSGTEGVVQRVSLETSTVHISGVTNTKRNGSQVTRPVHVSNCLLVALDRRASRRVE